MNRVEPTVDARGEATRHKGYYESLTPGIEACQGWTAFFVAFLVGVAVSVGIGIWLGS